MFDQRILHRGTVILRARGAAGASLLGAGCMTIVTIASIASGGVVTHAPGAPLPGGATFFVDDDGPGDPGPGDCSISDPAEDGSAGHPFDCIQEAIDAAASGDQVIVADGLYDGPGNKNLDYAGKDLTVRSANGPTACIIDCEGAGRGFYLHSGEGVGARIEGFRIVNGGVTGASPGGNAGAGIYCTNAAPRITDCRIEDGRTEKGVAGWGAGLYFLDAGPVTVADCVIAGNIVRSSGGPDGGHGGGVYADSSYLRIENSTIANNESGVGTGADDGGRGGGIYANDTALWVERTMVADNIAQTGGLAGAGGDGGGMACVDSVVTIVDCDVERNTTEGVTQSGHGAGLFIRDSLGGVLVSHFADNTTGPGGKGGGISAGAGSLAVDACAFMRNTASAGGGVHNDDGLRCITESMFDDNDARVDGGGLCNRAGDPAIDACVFRNNEAGTFGSGRGGGAECGAGSPVLTDCVFETNTAATSGGGMCAGGSPVLAACSFSGNSASVSGGGLTVPLSGVVTLSGVTGFASNESPVGPGLFCRGVTIVADGPVLQGADAFVNLGQLRLGRAAENDYVQLAVEMPYVQTGDVGGSIVVDVGTAPGEHDQVQFAIAQTFSGAMQVRLRGGVFPPVKTSFPVITGPALAEQFDVIQLPGSDDLIMTVSYGAGGDGAGPSDARDGGGVVSVNVDPFGVATGYGVGEFFNIPAGSPTDMVLDFFDEDAFIDVALTLSGGSESPGSLVVLFNAGVQGGGWLGYSSAFQFPAGLSPSGITSGRFVTLGPDEEENLPDLNDIAITNAGSNEVWVYTNRLRRQAAFVREATIEVGESPSALTVYDLMRDDDKLDIALTNFGDGVGPGTVEFLVNDGDGGFNSELEIPMGSGALTIDPADIDDDKYVDQLDIVVLQCPTDLNTPPTMGVLIAQEKGFLAPRFFETDAGSIGLVAADLDGDGALPLDIVTANFTAGTASILINRGGIGENWLGFAPAINVPVAEQPRSITSTDVNLDGRLDVALVVGEETVVQVIRNEGQNVFTTLAPIDDESSPLLIRAADVDNNGLADLVTVSGAGAGADGGGDIGVRLNDTCLPIPDVSVVYVDKNVLADNGNGTSWQDAIRELRTALCRVANSPNVTEIRVAQGRYTPAAQNGDRNAAFELIDGVRIYGGYPTRNDPPGVRDPLKYETILSGDLNGDDQTGGDTVENSNNVVYGLDVGAETVLDGFTLRDGNANIPADRFGRGGGIYLRESECLVNNCRIVDNSAVLVGGGVHLNRSAPTFTNCEISRNKTDINGDSPAGGLNIICSSPVIINCVFRDNIAQRGGAIGQSYSCPIIVNCLMEGNEASEYGGAMVSGQFSSPVLTNCTIVKNMAPMLTGGIWLTQGDMVTITNTIIWGNYGVPDDPQIVVNDHPREVMVDIYHSTIERCGERTCGSLPQGDGWCCADGIGNLDLDPMFVDAAGGDFRLAAGSPCIDAGNSWGLSASEPSFGAICDRDDMDGDGDTAELIPVDLVGSPRFADDAATEDTGCGTTAVVDMGVYEAGDPVVFPLYYADLNADGQVDFGDIIETLGAWGTCGAETCCVEDLNLDGVVDFGDIIPILQNYRNPGASCVDRVGCTDICNAP